MNQHLRRLAALASTALALLVPAARATAPASQNFDSVTTQSSATGGSLTLSGVIYSTNATNDQLRVDTISNITGSLPSLGTGKGLASIWLGTNTGTYFQFASVSNADNFKLTSFNGEVWGHSSQNSEVYTIKGYDNGTEVASATVNFRVSATYGSGTSTISYTRLTTSAETTSSNDGANAGTLTFTGSAWGNIDQVRAIVADSSPNIILGISVDNIVFAAPDVPAVPEIAVTGNSTAIADGATTTSTANHTDFGSRALSAAALTRTFTITNSGTSALTLSGSPVVSLGGTHAADFSVAAQPGSNSIAASGTTTFQVSFVPTALGARTATVSFANSDSDENPYNFAISGTGTATVTDLAGNAVSNVPYTSGETYILASTSAPAVASTAASTIAATSATLAGNVTADGGASVTDRGIVWSTSSTLASGNTTVSIGTGTGTFSQSITGLSPSTTYYFRAFATNSVGTANGSILSFTTLPSAPTIATVAPTSGALAGGTTVTLTGTNFSGATAVTFGGTAATSYTVNSATSITATAPAHAAGAFDVVVTTAGGSAASTGGYTYVAAPAVASLSPSAGPIAGGTSVALTGTDFTGATAVTFGTTAATAFTVNSATSITATSPAGSIGTVNVRVTAPGGTSALATANEFTYANAGTLEILSKKDPAASGYAGSHSGDATVSNSVSGYALSETGRYVAFISSATNLVAGQNATGGSATANLFLRDRTSDTTKLISVVAGTTTSTAGGCSLVSISSDGRYVSFASTATNLISGLTDTNTVADIFLYDRDANSGAGGLALVSHVSGDTTVAGSGTSGTPLLSRDGSTVVFISTSTNLVSPATSGQQLFRYNRATAAVALASPQNGTTASTAGVNAAVNPRAVSDDGRWILFSTAATDVVASYSGTGNSVFLFDSQAGTTRLLNRAAGTTATAANGVTASIAGLSSDGRYVTFVSAGSNLVSGQTGTGNQVYLYNRLADTVTLVSRSTSGATAGSNAAATFPSGVTGVPVISRDGRFIAFSSTATDLVSGYTGSNSQFYLYDRLGNSGAGSLTLITRTAGSATTGTAGFISAGAMSPNGSRFVFASTSSDLPVSVTGAGLTAIYAYTTTTGTHTLIGGTLANASAISTTGAQLIPNASPDGTLVAFYSVATDLAANDNNAQADFFGSVQPLVTIAPEIFGSATASATNGTAFSYSITAANTPTSYAVTGTLPTGVTLNTTTGVLSGTPTQVGTFNVTLTATNAGGTSGNFALALTVAAIAPGAPTIGTATAGDTTASVAFTAPASDGGSAITGYTVTASPGGLTGTGTTSPITVNGLTNGTAYTFTVTATNAIGTGTASAASNSVTPQAPQTITFANPGAQNFGTSPTLTATSTSGLAVTFTSSTPSIATITSQGTLTFLAPGTATILADQAGNSAYLAATQVSRSFTVNAVAPGAPTIGTATPSSTQASVTFTAPTFTGGAAITGYTVTSNPGGLTGTGTTSPITVTGLTNGTAYTFTVTATNSAGTGAASAASSAVTPATVPGAPTIGTATPANAQASVAFTAPASNGGATITSYTVTSSPGGLTATGATSPLVVTGLTNGTAYTFTVTATNSVGTGAASAASSAVTPAQPPVITTHPQTQTAPGLGSTTLTVAASGTAPFTYQWYFNNNAMSGQVFSTLVLPQVLLSQAGSYHVVVSNVGGSATSDPAVITVGPYVTNSSPARSVGLGGKHTFFVTAEGSGTLSYQWRKAGSPISGATNATYLIDPVTLAHAGSYDVVVSHSTSSTTTTAPAAVLTTLPNASVYLGSTTIADAAGVTAYLAIEGTAAKQLIIAAYGPALNDVAAVLDPQIVVESATGTSVATNDNWGSITDGTFSTTYARLGLRALATNSKDAVVYASLPAGSYRIRVTGVSGATGKVSLAIADADLNPASRLAYLGVQGPVSSGAPLTGGFTIVNSADKKLLFRAVSSPLGTAGLTDPVLKLYDSDGTTVVAQNNDWAGDSTLTTAFTQAGAFALGTSTKDSAVLGALRIGTGSYTAQITAGSGSGTALFEVYDLVGTTPTTIAPLVIVSPVGQTVSGGNVTLSATAIGGGTLSYQWRKAGNNIANATSATLSLTSVLPADSGSYDVVVSTSLGAATATSDAAVLQVVPSVNASTGPVASSYKAAGVLGFTLTYNGTVTVTGTPRLALTLGSATAYATYDSANSTATALKFTYTVQAGDNDADGIATATTVDLNGGTIKDSFGNTVGLTFTAPTLTSVLVDTTPPTLTSVAIASNNLVPSRAKVGDTVTVTFTASEPIATPTATIAGRAATIANTTGNTYTASLVLAVGDAEGTVPFSVAFTDTTGNAGTAVTATTNSSSVLFDRTAPTLTSVSIASNNASAFRAKVGDTVTVTFTASEAVATPTATLLGRAATVALVTGNTYTATVTAAAGDPEGTVAFALTFADVTGNAGTTVTATTDSSSVNFDRTAPTLSPVTIASSNANPIWAKVGDTVTVTFTVSEPIVTPTATIAGRTATVSNNAGIPALNAPAPAITTYTASLVMQAGDAEGPVAFAVSFVDLTGNAGTTVTATTNSSAVTFDKTAPVITSPVTANTTYKSAFTYTVAASGAAVSYGATSLPPGLTLSAGVISGAVTTNGSFTVALSATDAAGNIGTASLALEVAKAPLTVSGITAASRTYDATTVATLATGSAALVGIVSGDTVTLSTASAAGAFATKTIGAAKTVQVSGLTISGTHAVNYTLTQPTTTADITAKNLTVAGVTAASKVYDGNTIATLSFTGASLVGIPSATPAEAVTLVTGAATGAFANANAGFTKTVQVSGLSLSGADAGNYTVTQPSMTANITPAPATVTITNLAHTYDGTPKSATITVVPAAATTIVYSNSGGGAPTAAGSYTVTATISDNNYSGSGTATLVIAKATQTIAFSLSGSNFNVGSTLGLVATASSGLPVTFSVVSGGATLSGATATITAAGPAMLRATQAGNENYGPVSAEQTFTGVATAKLAQTITFPELPGRTTTDLPFGLGATASSGLPITYTILSGPAFLSGNNVTQVGAPGTVVIRASQAGNATYAAAPDVIRSYAVTDPGSDTFFGDLTDDPGLLGEAFVPAGQRSIAAKVGDVAAVLFPGTRRGNLLIVAPARSLNVSLPFTLNQDGSYTVTFTSGGANLSVTGSLSGTRLNGRIPLLSVAFSTLIQARTGITSGIAGYYESDSLNTATGGTASIVGPNGQLLIVAATSTVSTGALGTVGADGKFNVAAPGATIAGAVDAPTTTVAGTIIIPGQAPVTFNGLAATTARTDRLINLSSRVRIGPAAGRTLITGFVVGGTASKRVLLRAVGPALTGFGVSGALSNPRLQLYDGTGKLLLENDDWTGADTAASTAQVGAFSLVAGSRDAALVTTLAPGAYTMHVIDGGETGVALAEIYDAAVNPNSEYQRLINISTRGEAGAGENVLIGGFIITGNAPKRVLVRGIGPGLAAFGLTGTLADPRLRVFGATGLVADNDDWSAVAADATATAQAARDTGAFALTAGSKDAAVILTLAPGAYTAQVGAADGVSTGVALVEIYELP